MDAKDLFKDYVPEILQYDPIVDAKPPRSNSAKTKKVLQESSQKHTIEVPAAEYFKEYAPEVLTYNPDVDGSEEYKIRDNHLNTKAALMEKIQKAKAARKSNKTIYRQNIRTENES